MNLPNKLTLVRILLVPVFMLFAGGVLLAYQPAGYFLAGAVFAVASFTDFLDGYLARRWHLVTDFGKFADPLADKLLTTTAFLYMMKDGVCSPVVLTLILAREFAVSGVRMVAASAPGGKVIAANWWGKIKTVLQMVTILVYYFGLGTLSLGGSMAANQAFYWVSKGLCWLVALVTVLSGAQYIWQNRQFINTAK
ncbi:CDP-diacylglycerol--glycerol-3-phosphate 3-phosphatidyltransferase [Gemmiger sp. An120]|uniref:CDP-diacylglycerol--glycerol-3-phosphate 3-phosphatidyltransferase n=1 Tax=Gemmiger TaxID=204475 RepID=UPI000B385293|nr:MULTISPECIES: CDP-diacylglycerol--glycerol-3-phosphate 3-phosphatidyltransferase [Gemmiger]MBM6914560.1 CDP-diacylglycerol--glycerol-3-phosphate 3-phosphatidyltransferase [Gemmiger formicilis]OUQ42652.1 CDP-diacylglycerol--glycerol-3-phosphate 3-phosphatidyltransferase [Gemmiger sp. An120]